MAYSNMIVYYFLHGLLQHIYSTLSMALTMAILPFFPSIFESIFHEGGDVLPPTSSGGCDSLKGIRDVGWTRRAGKRLLTSILVRFLPLSGFCVTFGRF